MIQTAIPFIDLKTQYSRIQESVQERMQRVFDHGQYIMGPEIAELEKQLQEFCGIKHCILCSSGTDALMLALMALGITAGDEVITAPFSFFATAEAICLVGAKPVFVDIQGETYNLDPALIEAAITPRTKAIMPVAMYGQCADMDAINAIAEKHHLPVIEDAAQSFGATYKGRYSCGLSTIGCTSFFPSKPLGCYGDGGACFTSDDALAAKLRRFRLHGQERRYHHVEVGLNGRMDTLQAAILLAKLPILQDELSARWKIGQNLSARLGPVVKTQRVPPSVKHVYAQFTIEVDRRERFQKQLQEMGIPTAVHYPVPLHLQPALAFLGLTKGTCPVAETVCERVVSLPMHPYLDEPTIDMIVSGVNHALSV